VRELVDLTLDFYRRKLHRGAVPLLRHHPLADYTMERLVDVARILREEHGFRAIST
jgi:predicted DNA-binding helix-hairpin-helix protein